MRCVPLPSRALLLGAALSIAVGGCTNPPVVTRDGAEAAPEFTVTTFEEQSFSLREQRGTPVVLNFWESWWPICQGEQPELNQVAEEFADEVAFVGVSNNDTVADGKNYAREFEVPYALAHAPEVWSLYGDPVRPTTIVIDEAGDIAARISGPITYESLKQAIEDVLA